MTNINLLEALEDYINLYKPNVVQILLKIDFLKDDYKKEIEDNEPNDFKSASRPLIKFLAENHHPHMKAIVESNKAELFEGIESIDINYYVID